MILLASTVVSCSKASVYEGTRHSAKNECLTLPSSQYEECMKQYQEDYESYNRKRESVKRDY